MTASGPAKAFLLAAGLGTRLRPLTNKTPKCLIPIGGKPLLHWWLVICKRLGVREVLINTHHLADQVRDFAKSQDSSVRIKLFHEDSLLGSAGTIAANKDFVDDESDFWIFYADTLIGADLMPLALLHRATKSDLTLGLFQSLDPKSGGVVELSKTGEILSFEEKPKNPKSNLVAAGVYVGGPELLNALPAGAGDLSKDVYPKLMNNACGLILDPVLDLGTPESYAHALREWDHFGFR